MRTWWRAVVRYPLSWIVIVAIMVAVVATVFVLAPPLFVTIAVIVLGAIAIVAWPFIVSARGARHKHLYGASRLPGVNEVQLRALADELDRLEDPRPAYQLQAIGEKRDNLVAILGRRMEAGELTYARYQWSAQQVYNAVISNLQEVSIAMTSISTIDPDYIDARLGELMDADGGQSLAEISSLQDRRALAVTQDAKVAYLLAQNESAMTLLDRTSTALADAPIGVSRQDTEAAMSALAELADRAVKYADP